MPTTPIFDFPYPSGSDRVMDGDNAMGTLAQAIENAFLGIRMHFAQLNTGNYTLTQTVTPLGGATFTYTSTKKEDVFVFFQALFDITTTGTGNCQVSLFKNNVDTFLYCGCNSSGTGRWSTMAVYHTDDQSVGTHTWDLRAVKQNAGGAVQVLNAQTRMVILRIPQE